jgi:hypothetical protein
VPLICWVTQATPGTVADVPAEATRKVCVVSMVLTETGGTNAMTLTDAGVVVYTAKAGSVAMQFGTTAPGLYGNMGPCLKGPVALGGSGTGRVTLGYRVIPPQ